jgi:phytol kinase
MHPAKGFILELKRKSVHLSSLWMVAALVYLNRSDAVALFFVLLMCMLAIEKLRHKENIVATLFTRYFGFMLRAHERKKMTGATYVLMGALFAALVCPRPFAVCAFAVMIVSDTVAALVGKQWGRTLPNGKSYEGSLAFFISACMVVFAVALGYEMDVFFVIAGLLGAAAGTFIEFHAKKIPIDDNLTIVFATGIVMMMVHTMLRAFLS